MPLLRLSVFPGLSLAATPSIFPTSVEREQWPSRLYWQALPCSVSPSHQSRIRNSPARALPRSSKISCTVSCTPIPRKSSPHPIEERVLVSPVASTVSLVSWLLLLRFMAEKRIPMRHCTPAEVFSLLPSLQCAFSRLRLEASNLYKEVFITCKEPIGKGFLILPLSER